MAESFRGSNALRQGERRGRESFSQLPRRPGLPAFSSFHSVSLGLHPMGQHCAHSRVISPPNPTVQSPQDAPRSVLSRSLKNLLVQSHWQSQLTINIVWLSVSGCGYLDLHFQKWSGTALCLTWHSLVKLTSRLMCVTACMSEALQF